MKAKIRIRKWVDGNWSEGTASAGGVRCSFCMKHFDEPSQWGIDGGRISKLQLFARRAGRRLETFANYDRGWDVRPATEAHRAILDALVKKYN